MHTVDIIVPIYNGYDDIQKCMESIFKYTDLNMHRVVLVNDKSPDVRILPLLKSYRRHNVELIDSPVNGGFSASVNKGMCFSEENDVLLLNSDTIVTKGWLEKIQACADSSPEIGTVTPFSNSATLCSTPVFCQDNPIPDNVTIDEYADLIERCSLKRYPEITVAVGFCMYIKREVINRVGLFDAATFGRGYGEENDFCNRAILMGYSNVLCDNAFVYHKGTGSFDTEEKKRLCEEHDQILQERYPALMRKNHLYCVTNPEQYLRDNIGIYMELINGKKNILYVIHSDFRADARDSVGGTQLHLKDLALGSKEEFNVFVAARDCEELVLTAYYGDKVQTFRFYIGQAPLFAQYTNRRLRELFDLILSAFRISMVHVHHTSGLSLDIYYSAHAMGIPVMATLHDYYYICPTIKLITKDGGFCGGCAEKSYCAECLKKRMNIATQVDYITRWRNENEAALTLCSVLITPSEAAKRIIAGVFPGLSEKIQVIAHGSSLVESEHLTVAEAEIRQDSRVHMVIDHMLEEKTGSEELSGWAILENVESHAVQVFVQVSPAEGDGDPKFFPAIRQERGDVKAAFNDDPRYLFSGYTSKIPSPQLPDGKLKLRVVLEHDGEYLTDGQWREFDNRTNEPSPDCLRVAFLGGLVPEKGSEIALSLINRRTRQIHWYTFGTIGDPRLEKLCADNLTKIGTYDRGDIGALLRTYQIDVVCVFSTWAETFCYTLSEAWLAGIPVVGTDIGAVGDRIRESGFGYTVPLNASAKEILDVIYKFKDPSVRAEMAEKLAGKPVRDIPEMVADYAELYHKQDISQCKYRAYAAEMIFEASRYGKQTAHPANVCVNLMQQPVIPEVKPKPLWKKIAWYFISRSSFLYRVYQKLKERA